MIRLLVLEDRNDTREVLVRIIEGVSEDITVFQAGSLAEARRILEAEDDIDAFLLDINLNTAEENDASGMTFAREVRQRPEYEFTPLIMITSVAGLEMRAYRELHCYQYIIKPFRKNEVMNLVRRLIASRQTQENKSVTVRKDGINYRIECEDIVYIQAVPRGICIHLRNEELRIPYTSIRQIIEKLPEESFLQCHRMNLINTMYIEYADIVNCMVKLKGVDEPLEIGVTYKNAVKEFMNGKG